MKTEQEPKYDVNEFGHVYNRNSKKVIPDGEPIFIFRASDKHAVAALEYYMECVQNDQHAEAISDRVIAFHEFATKHPDKMKEPDT